MEKETLICNSSKITYNKGYIALWLDTYPLPEAIEVGGVTLLKKDHFHVSLLCVKNILEKQPDFEQDILNHFCDFIKDNDVKFDGFTLEFRIATDDERKSVVALCNVSNLDKFVDYLSEKIGTTVAHQPTHVTIYTLQPNMGIGLNSKSEMEQKTVPVEMPDIVTRAL